MLNKTANHAETNEPRAMLFDAITVKRPWGRLRAAQLVSAVLHLGFFALLVHEQASAAKTLPKPQKPHERVIKLFAAEPQKKHESTAVSSALSQVPAQSVVHAPVTPKDSKRLRIAFSPDPSGEQLRSVMQRFGAAFAFASPDEVRTCETPIAPGSHASPECFFRYQVVAPDWDFTEGHYSLGGYFLVALSPPDPAYLKALRAKFAIPQDYSVYALLPESMRGDIYDSIDEELGRNSQPGSTAATSVEITFSATEPRGFQLRILSTVSVDPEAESSQHTVAAK